MSDGKPVDEGLKQIERLKNLKQLYTSVFETENGKAVLEDLEKRCFIHSTTMDKEANVVAFREGQRLVYLHIQYMLTLNIPDLENLERDAKIVNVPKEE